MRMKWRPSAGCCGITVGFKQEPRTDPETGWGRLPGEELPVSDALCGAGAWQAAVAEGSRLGTPGGQGAEPPKGFGVGRWPWASWGMVP